MDLAAKLDRLRSRPAEPGDALAQRLRRLRPGAGAPPRTTPARLAGHLHAELLDDGLLRRVRSHPLPAAVPPADLTMLPEVWRLRDPDWVYIDTETTGLSGGVGNLAFMIGVARLRGQALEVRQYLLGSFAAEPAMLRAVTDWIGDAAVLVSYNGKCFDLPLFDARRRIHALGRPLDARAHLDLMYTVRRAYQRHWPDCRLQTAEQRLLGLSRKDDLPGAAAPAAWQAWLRRGDPGQLAGVLRHNYQDVVSLALLHRALLRDYAGSARAGVNHAAVGLAWCDAGGDALAEQVWAGAAQLLDDAGLLQLAALYRRRGEWRRAESIWLALYRRGSAQAALALSKYYEHRRRDYRRAMRFAEACEAVEGATRRARLERKIGADPQLPLLRPAD